MNIGLVVSTLGRTEPLERLLRSLTDQLTADDHVVIVAQQRLAEVTALANRFRDARWPITVTTSAPGAARGRNVGVAALPPGDRLLHFPNDTTWFPPGTLAAGRAAMGNGEGGVGALTIVDEHGPKFVLPPPGSSLTIWNVWQVIEMGILIRRSLFDQICGFDPLLGTGALSPWQAGEATDLLLRLRVTRPDVAASFTWLPAHITVGGVADPAGLSTRERRRKLRAYGRGMGRVVARHRYPFWWRAAFTVGGLAFGLRHRATNTVLDGWWVFLGRTEGALGRTLGDGATAAVTRRLMRQPRKPQTQPRPPPPHPPQAPPPPAPLRCLSPPPRWPFPSRFPPPQRSPSLRACSLFPSRGISRSRSCWQPLPGSSGQRSLWSRD